jgi:hypothetical protein
MKLPIRRLPNPKLADSLVALVLLVAVVAGCKQMQSLASPTLIKSPDGKFQLTVPGGWQEKPSLNAKASIGAANPLEEMYVIVITESKADFTAAMTLDEFTNITRNSIVSNLLTPEATQPELASINGNSARAYEVEGAIKGVKLAYRIYTVETADHFHQIITWTLLSKKDANHETLQKVITSFRPI